MKKYTIEPRPDIYNGEPVTRIKSKDNFGSSFWVQNDSGTRWYVDKSQLREIAEELVDVEFISVWDVSQYVSRAKYNPVTWEVTDIESIETDGSEGVLDHQYIRLPDGKELEVEMNDENECFVVDDDRKPYLNPLEMRGDPAFKPADYSPSRMSCINEMQEIIDTLENDKGTIPFGIWKRILALKTKK